MLRRSIPKELVAVLVTAAAATATEDLFCSKGGIIVLEDGAGADILVVEAAVLAELLAWVVAAAGDSEYHFLSMYFIRMNSFSFTGSLLLPSIDDSLSLLYLAKYFALKAALPTLASMATSISVKTLMDRPLTLNWKSRLINRVWMDNDDSEWWTVKIRL